MIGTSVIKELIHLATDLLYADWAIVEILGLGWGGGGGGFGLLMVKEGLFYLGGQMSMSINVSQMHHFSVETWIKVKSKNLFSYVM